MSRSAIKAGIRISQKAQHHRSFHGVSIVRGGVLLGFGFNHDEIHAEVAAIRLYRCNDNLKGSTLISTRVTKTDRLANARPCVDCMQAIRFAGIKRIIYSDNLGVMQTEKVS